MSTKKILLGVTLSLSFVTFSKTIELEEAVRMALGSHPSLLLAKANVVAEQKSIAPLYFPDNPMVGIEDQNGMKSLTFSQEVAFPTKYSDRGAAQEKKMLSVQEEFKKRELETRQKVITAYYSLLLQKKTLEILLSEKDLLREIARTAEGRRAIGQVSAQEEMKAHLEQSKVENEILLAQQEIDIADAKIKELLGVNDEIAISELKEPTLILPTSKLATLEAAHAPTLTIGALKVQEAEANRNFAKASFLPDFKISLQKSIEKNSNDQGFAVEMRVPLWFFAKESGEYSSAKAKSFAAEKSLLQDKRELISNQKALAAKITAKISILKLYTTTLIPQAKSTIVSARSGYQAGRVSLMDLLDSERIVYSMQTAYFVELREFATSIAEFETTTGQSISSLPFGVSL